MLLVVLSLYFSILIHNKAHIIICQLIQGTACNYLNCLHISLIQLPQFCTTPVSVYTQTLLYSTVCGLVTLLSAVKCINQLFSQLRVTVILSHTFTYRYSAPIIMLKFFVSQCFTLSFHLDVYENVISHIIVLFTILQVIVFSFFTIQ